MDCKLDGEGPALLQLHKWGASQFRFDLSEFREAFISPTRKLLVLLSYQCEALLLPLLTGDSVNAKSECCHKESSWNHSSVALWSRSVGRLSRSELKDDIPCTSASSMNDDGFSSKHRFSRSNGYSFVCDVKSLAWGVCGDTYDQHKDALFREFLFVSGSQGVVVHAFRDPDKVNGAIDSASNMLEGQYGQGKWVVWSPSSKSKQNLNVHRSSGLFSEGIDTVVDVNDSIGLGEGPLGCVVKSAVDKMSRDGPSRIWLRSFCTTVETFASDGSIWTRFPQEPSFPCLAEVVSFKILDSDLPLQVMCSSSVSKEEDGQYETALLREGVDLTTKSTRLCNGFGIGQYNCFRVFSGKSHSLLGFVLRFVDPDFVIEKDDYQEGRIKELVLIARLDGWGMQWVTLVKLVETENPMSKWVDFCFSGDLLVCLNAFGMMVFYAALTGEALAHINVFQACGLNPRSSLKPNEKVLVQIDAQKNGVDEVGDDSISQTGDIPDRGILKKILVDADSSLLAAVDNYGVVYVMHVADCLPDSHHISEEWVLQVPPLGLGMLAGYEVGGFDIGQQRNYSKNASMRCRRFPFYDSSGDTMPLKIQSRHRHGSGFSSSGFTFTSDTHSSSSHTGVKSQMMRKVFLPTESFSDDDCFCFSHLGITQLMKRHSGQDQRSAKIVHLSLLCDLVAHDDTYVEYGGKKSNVRVKEEASVGEALGCSFQGWLYLVTATGISIVLPSLSLSPSFLPVEAVGYWLHGVNAGVQKQVQGISEMKKANKLFAGWKVEVLDRVLIYEGPEEADRLCLDNGWDFKLSWLRQMQVALYYLKFDEIEKSLEKLEGANLAEEGILRLLFAAAFVMLDCNDSEVSAAARLLSLATRFTTKLIRSYGSHVFEDQLQKEHSIRRTQMLCLPPIVADEVNDQMDHPTKLRDMAYLLEIIRNMQYRLGEKFKRPGQGLVNAGESLSLVDADLSADDLQLSVVTTDAVSLDAQRQNELLISLSSVDFNNEKLALVSKGSMNSGTHLEPDEAEGLSAVVAQDLNLRKKVFPIENAKQMIARWELDNLDTKTVVKDALLSGRLPLAVLQLHLYRMRDPNIDNELPDTFSEVRLVAKDIAYDLFLKGDTGLAVVTLQKLGEDVESCLKQLLFGTVRRSLRVQVAEQMRIYGYLEQYEWKILDRMLLIERLYPSNSFWRTFHDRNKAWRQCASALNSAEEIKLQLLHSFLLTKMPIDCGEVDGVVLGSWTGISDCSPDLVVNEDTSSAGYWAAAAVWCSGWDQSTIDRIVLDQPFAMGVHVLWESQLEYFVCHNVWEEVQKLIDVMPRSVLFDGTLQVALDDSQDVSDFGCGDKFLEYRNYICSIEELDAVCVDVPSVKMLKFPVNLMCSISLRILMEQKLAKELVFLKEYWEGTADIVALLARSGFIINRIGKAFLEDYAVGSTSYLIESDSGKSLIATVQALHKVVIHHCVQCYLPDLLDLYLDYHKLILDNDSLCSLQEAAGDCHWAKWLLLSRIKGHEYDASFCNARSIMSRNVAPDSNLSVLDMDEMIHTVDDVAEGGSETAALATLMYASDPIQNCLNRGSVKRHSSSSAQCTLESLKCALQQFPTLRHTLVAASFGQEISLNFFGYSTNNALSDYLNWRDSIFFSSTSDTSLLQMLPCWFPKAIRRLIQLYIQGPLGWQSLMGVPSGDSLSNREIDFCVHADENTEVSAMSWEATIQKLVKEELFSSSLKDNGPGLEHNLHRGRAFAAFNQIVGHRVKMLKSGQASALPHGQANVQLDVQTLLRPLSESEGACLSTVIPLAIKHFEDSVLVASCAFVVELCGLSSSMLCVDIVALRRISAFHKTGGKDDKNNQFPPKGSAFHLLSCGGDVIDLLAQSLADEYLHLDCLSNPGCKGRSTSPASQSHSRAVMLVLQHLERASLPPPMDGKSCGSWLSTGNGDGAKLRSKQKADSQHWNLVTVFCQIHVLPPSLKYLAFLAKDNDWVGFLSEAQIGGYPFETVIQVATNQFSDPRLRVHILNVLKGIQSRKKAGSSTHFDGSSNGRESILADHNSLVPAELFRILAECEKKKNPGQVLLKKAREMSWSILAMVASCFPDVSPLSCLTVWLEITAASETSSIKVHDIASQIADNVGAAVIATNTLPVACRAMAFHYNRHNPKRRRLLESVSSTSSDVTSRVSSTCAGASSVAKDLLTEEEKIMKAGEHVASTDSDEGPASLSKMVALLCEQHLFLPLLRAFEMFLPSCSLLPFIRALQAFSQMRLSEASAHLGSFSARIRDESCMCVGTSWISSTAVNASDAVLSTCPSPYEKRCLLQLLATTDFGDGGSAAAFYKRLYLKINLAESLLQKDNAVPLADEILDDAALLTLLENAGQWEKAHNWARHLEASGGPYKSDVNHVTESQAESMVAEWKEFLWDVPEERVALWGHCHTLFIRYSFPALQAGLFFLKHAEAVEKDLPAREIHELLLLSLQWLSGMMTLSTPLYPMHLLREIEMRVWLLAVESEAQTKSDKDFTSTTSSRDPAPVFGSSSTMIDRTADLITKMDNHINAMRIRSFEKHDTRDNKLAYQKNQEPDSSTQVVGGSMKAKRRVKGYGPSRRTLDGMGKITDAEDCTVPNFLRNELQLQDENLDIEMSFSKWEERVGPAELERAVLSLLEFGQITASKQLHHKLSPGTSPPEFKLVDAALTFAAVATSSNNVSLAMLNEEVFSVVKSCNLVTEQDDLLDPLQALEKLTANFNEGSGCGLCKKIIAVVKAAKVLGLSFSEAFDKQPIELLRLLSLKGQESFEEAYLLVQNHAIPAASIAQILAESFLKGLLAAHRGGYVDSQKEEGPAPLLWRFSDFLKWAELCPSEPEIGHALMRLVITGQEIPHACEVELLILSHHFYKSTACLDGVDVLVSLAANRVDDYVSEGDFPCLARLITGVGNFHALNFILGILIENGQLDLLLQKYSAAADANTGTAEAVRGFRMAVLTSLKHFNAKDLDAFAMVYNHFDMKHEKAALLESRAWQSADQWFRRYDKDQNEDLLESMRYFIEAAEVYSSIDAGNKTRKTCAQASLVSLQIRMPDSKWLNLSETNARRLLVEQSRFQEALIVAEAYGLNQPAEWALVLWNQMLKPEVIEEFVAEFVAVLPLQSTMLIELAKFYRAEVAARVDQSQFSVWLTGGGLPAEWAKYLERSFRCLLKRTRDLKLRLQLATIATGFSDFIDACMKVLDKVPDNAGPLVLRRGHGGAYLPLM